MFFFLNYLEVYKLFTYLLDHTKYRSRLALVQRIKCGLVGPCGACPWVALEHQQLIFFLLDTEKLQKICGTWRIPRMGERGGLPSLGLHRVGHDWSDLAAVAAAYFKPPVQFSSVQFIHSVVSESLQPHELQHARLPCPSPTPGVYSNSCPTSQWCHPAISSSVVPFSSHPQSLPASVFSTESTLHMRWPKYWSFSFSITPSKEHPGLISFRMDWLDFLAVQGTLKSFSSTTVQKHQFFGAQPSSQSNSHIHTWPLEKP